MNKQEILDEIAAWGTPIDKHCTYNISGSMLIDMVGFIGFPEIYDKDFKPNDSQLRFLVDRGNPTAWEIAKKLCNTKPGQLIPLTSKEYGSLNSITMLTATGSYRLGK